MRVRGEIPESFRRRPGLSRAAATRPRGERRAVAASGSCTAIPRRRLSTLGSHGSSSASRGCYALRMPAIAVLQPQHRRSVLRIPLPRAVEQAQTIHVSARPEGGLPRAQGVQGTRRRGIVHLGAPGRARPQPPGGHLVASSGSELSCSSEASVAAGDYLVTGDEPYSGIAAARHAGRAAGRRLQLREPPRRAEAARGARPRSLRFDVTDGDDYATLPRGSWASGARTQPPRLR